METYKVVKDKRTLKAIERMGFISQPKHDFYPRCEVGLNYQYAFEYKGSNYSLKYFDGCFYPYLVKMLN